MILRAALLCGLIVAPLPAAAQTIEEARRAYLEADFRASADRFEAVLQTPSVDRAAAVEAHRHLAALRLLLGDETAAREHAEATIALDPAAAAPEGAPPALEGMLASARERFGGRAASIDVSREARGETHLVRAVVDPSPRVLARAIGLRCAVGTDTAEAVDDPPEVELEVDASGGSLHCRAWIAGHGGAHLIEVQRQFDSDGASLVATDDDEGGGSAWPWIGLGVAVVAAGVVVAYLVASSAGGDGAQLGSPRAEGW